MTKQPLTKRQERLLGKELLRREQLLVAGGVAAIPTEAELEKAKILRGLMHEGQTQFFFTDMAKGRRRIRKTGRRWGKTTGHAIKHLVTMLERPRAVTLYLEQSRPDIQDKIWPELLKLIAEYDLPFDAKEAALKIVHKRSTGRMLCRGAADVSKIDKLRGLGIGGNFVLASIDESATFGARIEKLVMSAISPGLRDARGEMLLTGTPGYYPEGLFYEASEGLRKNWITYPAATAQDNPFLPADAKDFNLIIEEEGLSGYDDPIFIREWLGQYCINDAVQMFTFDPKVNTCTSYPNNLTFYGAVDFGWVDESAIVVVGFSPQTKAIYAVNSWSASRQDADEIAEQMLDVKQRFNIERWIGDTAGGRETGGGPGGSSKKIAEQLWRDYGLYIEPAQKQEKLSYVQFMNSAFKRKELLVMSGTGLAAELPKVLWNEKKTDASKRAVDNNSMALLYGWRAAKYLAGKQPARESSFTDSAEKLRQDQWPEEETANKLAPTQTIDIEDWYLERLLA